VGFGAHFDPRIALLRAVTEVNQFPPLGVLHPARRFHDLLFGDDLRDPFGGARAGLPILSTCAPTPSVLFAERRSSSTARQTTLPADVRLCVEQARERGLEVLVLDQTRPDIGLSVVRVVIQASAIFCAAWAIGACMRCRFPKAGSRARVRGRTSLNPHTIFF